MKTIKHIAQGAIVVLFVLVGAQALAQDDQTEDLTKAEKGRVAIAKCYSACFAEAMRERSRLISGSDFVQQAAACEAVQLAARATDACRAECVDLEAVYGVRTSHARNRFIRVLSNAELQRTTDGLWVDYQNSPERGTSEFDAACDRYFGTDASSEAVGSVFAKPKETSGKGTGTGAGGVEPRSGD